MSVKYSYRHNRGSFYKGDTIDALEVRLTLEADGSPIVPTSVCAQVYTSEGRVVHEWDVEILPDGSLVLPAVDADWPALNYTYSIKYKLSDDRYRTYIIGSISIIDTGSRCS